MIPLATAIKLGAFCMTMLTPDVMFCRVGPHRIDMICMADGCHTPREVANSPRLLAKVYGEKE